MCDYMFLCVRMSKKSGGLPLVHLWGAVIIYGEWPLFMGSGHYLWGVVIMYGEWSLVIIYGGEGW
jgi:hypothetical protein